MKKFLLGLFITINLTLSGKTYYVATSGTDANPGTLNLPFATWGKLSDVMVAGDVAYIRGGTYRSIVGAGANVVYRLKDLHGTVNDTIKIFAYPGEKPVLNLDNITMTSSYCFIVFVQNCSYLHIKGLRITGLKQQPNGGSICGMRFSGSPHNLIDNIEIDHLGMYGMTFESGSDYNYVKNCDVHHLADPYTGYGASNGFNRTGGSTANHLYFYGCRAWACSDDGWDLFNSDGYVTIENCWAFWNGYLNEYKTDAVGGDGSGIKIGPGVNNTANVTRIVTNCLAVENKQYGFNQNFKTGVFASHIYNNIAFKNGNSGFIFTWGPGGDADIFRNNIAYLNRGTPYVGDSGDTQDHNSWNGGVTVTDADFKNLDVTQLARPRKADGSLPDIDFLHLAAGSDIINAGINVGLPYGGSAPDLGAFESDIESYVPPTPVYVSSLITNSAPSVIEMTYNLSLVNIVPAISAFSVQVNSVARSLNSVAISGTKVLLTLSSPVAYGNTITVAYTKPSANPIQTSAGGQAASITAQTASNGVNAVVTPPPVVVTPPPVVVTPPPVVVTPPPVVVTPPPVVVTPPVVVPNAAPVAVVNYINGTYSGFVGELNATGSYDADKDNLSFTWKIPNNISVSATNTPVIEFLAPIVETKQIYDFTLTVSDGKTTQSKTVPVEVLPYQPGLETAEVIAVEAGDFQNPYLPYNAVDGNIGTMWSAIGNDKWIILELKELFTIQHVKVAFQPGQKKESYFDVLGSNDKKNWEPVLSKSRSCNFSGDMQVFEFPPSKSEEEYRYIKLIGQGNSLDNWNYISEFRIFGYKHKNPTSYEDLIVKMYPNPASEIVNIIIDDPSFNPDFINIVGLTGKILHTEKLDPAIRQFQLPVNFRAGIYIVQMGIGEMTMFTQKLVISR